MKIMNEYRIGFFPEEDAEIENICTISKQLKASVKLKARIIDAMTGGSKTLNIYKEIAHCRICNMGLGSQDLLDIRKLIKNEGEICVEE